MKNVDKFAFKILQNYAFYLVFILLNFLDFLKHQQPNSVAMTLYILTCIALCYPSCVQVKLGLAVKFLSNEAIKLIVIFTKDFKHSTLMSQ